MELRLKSVGKKYDKQVLKSIDYCFTNGLYGLLGPNGAGKSTLIRLICGLEKTDEGVVCLDEEDIILLQEKYRGRIGYLPQEVGFYPFFDAYNYLKYIATLKGINSSEIDKKIKEVLHTVNLHDVGSKKIKNYSGGMKQRLGIAQAIINEPDILILDEPTVGLDLKERMAFKQFISEYALNHIVILATHIVSDIEDIAEKVLILKEGRIRIADNPQKLLDTIDGYVWGVHCNKEDINEIKRNNNISNMRKEEDGRIQVRIVSEEKPYADAITISPNLQDLYLYYFEETSV